VVAVLVKQAVRMVKVMVAMVLHHLLLVLL
jgi:hypothetical protein